MDQHHLVSKDDHTRPNMVTKRRFVRNKTFLLGPIVLNKVISCFISTRFIIFLYIHEMPTKASNDAKEISDCERILIFRHTLYDQSATFTSP